MWNVLLIPLLLVLIVIYLSVRKFNYWKTKNVPHLKPTLFLGNYGDFILLKTSIGNVTKKIFQQFPEEPYVGAYFGTEPTLLVQDPDLLKLIFTKDFYYFNGREVSKYWEKEAITKGIFFAHGDRWKNSRQMLTPLYTTGKMKNMFPLIENCTRVFENVLEKEVSVCDVIEMNSMASRFTIDCVGSCALGIETNAMKNFANNPYSKIVALTFQNTNIRGFLNIARSIWPRIFYSLGFQLFPPVIKDSLAELVTRVIQSRHYKPSSRNDFLDLLLNLKQKRDYITRDSSPNAKTGESYKVNIDEETLVGHAASFFAGAVETSATTITLTLFEIAKAEEVQLKVYNEIKEYLESHDFNLTYNCQQELPYLNACIDETLRLYPLFTVLTREVMEDYTFPTGLRVDKGVRVHIPVYHIHRNPKNFPEPEMFRPERHLGDERLKIKPYTYLPFGEGPRFCIGMRFGKMQVLAGLVTVLKNYKVKLADGMPQTVDFDPRYIVGHTRQDINLKFAPRKELNCTNPT